MLCSLLWHAVLCRCYGCDNFVDSYLVRELHPVFAALHRARFGESPAFPAAARSMADVRFDAPAPAAGAAAPAAASAAAQGEGEQSGESHAQRLEQLVALGFDASLCEDVLAVCGGDVAAAANRLLG
jgi:hypothetical protein